MTTTTERVRRPGEPLRIAEDHLDLGTFVFTRQPYDPDAPVPGGVDEDGWRA